MIENSNKKNIRKKFLFWINFLFFIIASTFLFFSVFFYTNKSQLNNYRYIAGREQMADTTKISNYLRPENMSTDERKKIWVKIANSYKPNPDLYFYAKHFLYNLENAKNIYNQEELEFYTKASVDGSLTADTRSLATMEVFNLLYYNRNHKDEIINLLLKHPPYPGLLINIPSAVDTDFALLQFSFDTFKNNSNFDRFLFLLTGAMQHYKFSNNKNSQEYDKYKNIYENLVFHPRAKFIEKSHLEKTDFLNNREQAINFLSYFISQVRLAELGYQEKKELVNKLKDKILMLAPETKFGDMVATDRYLFHLYLARVKYFIFVNDKSQAKIEIENLDKLLTRNHLLVEVLYDSVYFKYDVYEIEKIFPNFLKNVKI